MYTESGKKKYAESKRLIQQAMAEKQLVLFVGAGASVASGMPLWRDAVAQIAEKVNADPDKENYLVIPQYYFNARGKKEYTQLMREIFKYKQPLNTTEVHKLIMAFSAETIITTNYDRLLEQAAEENGIFMHVVAKDTDLPYRKAGRELIKMHGDFEHDNFVLKEDDYLHYHKNFKLIETYVKSLIGTKTVLFIGYSLSDPDVKQIINWVKEILDEEFQHAYMINTHDLFSENQNEYFKHLGVNLIYSHELLEGVDDETDALIQVLRYLLDDESKRGLIDQIYEDLKPFQKMNYTLQKYVKRAIAGDHLNSRSLYINNTILASHSKEAESEGRRLLSDLTKTIKGEKERDSRIHGIYKALRNSYLYGVESDNELIPFPETEQLEYEEAMESFDFSKLRMLKEKNANRLSEDAPELYLQQAMICSSLRDYVSAFYCLDNAAKIFYRKGLYSWYFIAQFNKVNIAKIVYQLEGWRTDEEEIKKIKEEAKSIDLNKTLLSIPDLGNHHNRYLQDLIEFGFSSSIMYEAYKTSRDVQKESKQTYIFHSAPPAYDALRWLVYDYYYYCTKNYIQVERYSENTEIYNLFARSLISSLSTPTIEEDFMGFPGTGETTNLHVDALTRFDIYLLLRYVDNSYLKEMLQEYNVKNIALDEEARDYIQTLSKTIQVYSDVNTRNGSWLIDKYLYLASYMEIDEEITVKILQTLESCKDANSHWDLRKSVTGFVQNIYKRKVYEYEQVRGLISAIISLYIDLFSNREGLIQNMWGPIISLMNCLYAAGTPYSDIDNFKKLIENEDDRFAIETSSDCSEEIKEYIRGYYGAEEQKEKRRNPYIYAYLALGDLTELSPEIEKEAFKEIKNELDEEKNSGVKKYPSNILLHLVMNMYLNDLVIDRSSFIQLVEESGEEYVKWMIDFENYDYGTFDLEWLTRCRRTMLQELAENDNVKKKIRGAFIRKYNEGKTTREVDNLVMRNFMEDGNEDLQD